MLAAALQQALQGGIIGQSLRQIAAAIGTSHRMLQYHFGSREGLLVAICNALNDAATATLAHGKASRELFEHYTDPEAWPWDRLFFEIYAYALLGGPGTEGFVEASVHRWIDALAGELIQHGADPATARIQARLNLAVARGLLLDLLATEDREGVGKAYEHYLQLVAHTDKQSSAKPSSGHHRK